MLDIVLGTVNAAVDKMIECLPPMALRFSSETQIRNK